MWRIRISAGTRVHLTHTSKTGASKANGAVGTFQPETGGPQGHQGARWTSTREFPGHSKFGGIAAGHPRMSGGGQDLGDHTFWGVFASGAHVE
jgi:hypothetical protein